ncbi:MAG: hypothetical protein ACYDCL_19695 [Myxococcales bacterium]
MGLGDDLLAVREVDGVDHADPFARTLGADEAIDAADERLADRAADAEDAFARPLRSAVDVGESAVAGLDQAVDLADSVVGSVGNAVDLGETAV